MTPTEPIEHQIPTPELVGIGHAIVDILAYKDKSFLENNGFTLGSMQLIDEEQVAKLTPLMGAATECSGGSAGNTLAGYAMLGGHAAFIGKVHSDKMGEIFISDMERVGVHYAGVKESTGDPTARSLVMVTEEPDPYGGQPDVERTMATYLGIAGQLRKADIDEDVIACAEIFYIEGYLWDDEGTKDAIRHAIEVAKANNTKVAFTLSDPFCVERHHAEFLELVKKDVDILFANEHEIEALIGEGSDLKKILHRTGQMVETAAITRSERGSYVVHQGEVHGIDPVKVNSVFDVTGAGDLYAAGFLYGYANGFEMPKAGRLASLCASEVIQYLGGRPVTKLPKLFERL